MATYAGWEGSLIIEGDQTKEILDEKAIGGSDVEYFVSHWPVVDSAGDVTDDEGDITVYEDDSAMSGADFTLDGSEGSISIGTVKAASKYTVSYESKETVGSWQGMEFDHKNNNKRVFIGGQRNALEIKEGLIEQGFKFMELYLDNRRISSAYQFLQNASITPRAGALPAFTVSVDTGAETFTMTGVKLDTTKMNLKHDDITATDTEAQVLDTTVA